MKKNTFKKLYVLWLYVFIWGCWTIKGTLWQEPVDSNVRSIRENKARDDTNSREEVNTATESPSPILAGEEKEAFLKRLQQIIGYGLLLGVGVNIIAQQLAFLYIFRCLITPFEKVDPKIICSYRSGDGTTSLHGIIYQYGQEKAEGSQTLIVYLGGNSEPVLYKQSPELVLNNSDQPSHIKNIVGVGHEEVCDIIFPARLNYGKATSDDIWSSIYRMLRSLYNPRRVIEKDLQGLATMIKQNEHYTNIKILGFSMGGWQALYLTNLLNSDDERQVSSLTLLAPLVNIKGLIQEQVAIIGDFLSALLWWNIDAIDLIKSSSHYAGDERAKALQVSIFLSDSDKIIPAEHSQVLQEALDAIGHKTKSYILHDAPHIKMLYITSAYIVADSARKQIF